MAWMRRTALLLAAVFLMSVMAAPAALAGGYGGGYGDHHKGKTYLVEKSKEKGHHYGHYKKHKAHDKGKHKGHYKKPCKQPPPPPPPDNGCGANCE